MHDGATLMHEARQRGLKEGLEKGLKKGQQQGEAALVLRQIKRRFGVLPDTQKARIQALDVEQLEMLGEDLLDFSAVEDLEAWLSRH